MANEYFEDIFIDFYESCFLTSRIACQHQDNAPIDNFYSLLIAGKPLTKPQADFILKILDKYKMQASAAGLNYTASIQQAAWKLPFRVLDQTKRIYVEKDSAGKLVVCLKHPYTYKEAFEKEVLKNKVLVNVHGVWDAEDKVRKFSIYSINLVLLNEFAVRHNFEIDNSFLDCLSVVEEIWNSSEDIVPHSIVHNNNVYLKNSNSNANDFFEKHKTDSLVDNMLLAKDLGYILQLFKKPENFIEKICSSSETYFWIKHPTQFFDLYNKTSGKIALLVNDDQNLYDWLQKFVNTAVENGVDKSEIKVCFREPNNQNPKFNSWVKDEGLGGSMDTGRLFIFKNKPPKWLFKEDIDVKIIVVNKPFPPMSMVSQNWISNHSCVIYIGDLKPSIQKENKIVEL